MMEYQTFFVQRLSEHDLEVLARLDAAQETDDLRSRLSDEPETMEGYLTDPQLYQLLFVDEETGMVPALTPHLAFAALVHQAARDLATTSYVPEWVGAGERLPVFDATALSDFIDDVTRRYLMIELLSSFTRISSGSVWVKTTRGYRRRRFSELDPVGLAEMVEGLPASQRPAGYRRLGEVALFLTGVFPDHTARHPISAMGQSRLARFSGLSSEEVNGAEYLYFLESVGSALYERAAHTELLASSARGPLEDMAENFSLARRFLNYLADRYLHRLETGLMNPVG